ncbi:MAG TPA: hypothetical protein IAD26_00275 [Candidatus Limenecus avicola]|uniref:Uncharacterized protein n=1 Tax=Candidatus Limenecus avicola TaxID=2840847 RepID=A0A9D1MY25_9CLOT|nr:hypothetical protein [Candidatus Limenecus avicola]
MAEINYFEIIQNKLDALVDKIIQKENSDEDFRITYAQILEKINTKMDIFASNETAERINLIGLELGKLIKERQEVVDSKFAAVKGEFDNLNQLVAESLKTPELLAAFNKIQNQIHYFTQEQDNQKLTVNSIISQIEKIGSLEETNDNLRANFAIVKEQNTIINENVNKQMSLITQLNKLAQDCNQKALEDLNTIIFSLKEFSESLNDDVKEIKDFVNEKVETIITKVHETDSFIEILNNNLTTLVKVVGNIFDDEEFASLRDDVAELLVKANFLSESVSKIATKEELLDNSEKNKDEIKKHNQELITELENKIVSKLDFSDIGDIKDYTEKMFFQGTEVLKEEIWSIKDTVNNVNSNAVSKEDFDNKLAELKALNNQIKEDITDIISEESVAASNQINEISATIEALKNDISNIILNEQNEQITTALQNLQTKFVSQLIQIADNISFAQDAEEINDNIFNCSDEIKEKISADITDIKQEIELLKGVSDSENANIVNLLTKIDDALKTDITSDLKALISGFKLLTTGLKEDKGYVYTLPDIESDLSKIRLDLNNIQKVLIDAENGSDESSSDITTKINNIKSAVERLQESPITAEVADIKELFDHLNEDIASISKRTNKLIISSDELTKVLKANIASFTSLINTFEKQSREFYNSAFLNDLNTKIDAINKGTNAILKSDQVLTEAFMYMGEWIDSASDSFDEIKNDLSKIKKNVLSEDDSATEKLEISVKNLSQRIDVQEAKIDSVDDKLNKIITQQNESKELKSLLEYVASQVSVTNEKIIENDKLSQKIASMEKQLKKIEKNLAVITEYIDEEDAQDDEFYSDEPVN